VKIKKIVILIGLLYLTSMNSANADDWLKIQNGWYINPKSIKKYQSRFSFNDRKTIWVKITDPKFMKDKEANMTLVNSLIDCNTNKTAIETVVSYYDSRNPESETLNEYQLNWSSIVPDTVGEFLFRLVCKGDLNEI